MNRRAFLATGIVFSGSILFGATEEFDSGNQESRGSVVMLSLLKKLTAVQSHVGYFRFNTIGLDETLKVAIRCKMPLSGSEIGYMENIFYGDPKRYGFFGERTINSLSERVRYSDLIPIKGTGHSLFKGASIEKYQTVKKLIGDDLVLTSGVRAPIKQLYLFLSKMATSGGDLRVASSSIAPPGFTFHSIGDFDIGKVGYGSLNFTEHFEETDVFKKLHDNGYISVRYTTDNPFGVRYEPWHIKVVGEGSIA